MIPDGLCNPSPLPSIVALPQLVRGGSILSSCILTKPFGFKHFSRPFRVSFHLLLTLLLRYRSWVIFRFAGVCPACSREKTIPCYSGYPASAFQLTITRLSRSMAQRSRGIHLNWRGRTGSITPHLRGIVSPGFGLTSSAFARRYSRNPCWFLFLRLLKCFTSPGSLPLT